MKTAKAARATKPANVPAPRSLLRKLGKVDLVVLGLLFVLLLVHAQKGWITTKDDAFITFRYAEHLAEGHGLVWNIGEGPVEGYTNFLFLAVMAVFAFFKADLVIAAKIVNLLSAFAIFFMLIEIFLRIYRDRYLLYFGLFLFVFPYFTSAQIAGGLETMFYAMLVTLGCLLLLRQIEAYSGKRQIAMALTLLAMGLTRPEGVLVAAAIIVIEMILIESPRRGRGLAVLALWYLAPAAVYMLGRFAYFHYWLPNPFYIKKSEKLFSLVGLIELQQFVMTTKIFVGLICLPFVAEKARKQLLVLAAVFIPGLAVYMFFRPMMNYAFRYYQPYYPLMLPVMAAPLFVAKTLAMRWLKPGARFARFRSAASVALLAAAIVVLCPYTGIGHDVVLGKETRPIQNYREFRLWRQEGFKLLNCHVRIGTFLRRYPEYRDRIIALGDVGAIPYYSRWKTLDLGGLNDVYLAHHGRAVSQGMGAFSTKLDLDYVFERDPAVVIVGSSNAVTVDHYASRILVEDPRFKAYERIVAYEYSTLMFEIVYVKKNDPSLTPLIDGLVDDAMRRGATRIEAKD
jgi:arabinofuranosyltransferase